MKTTSLIYLFNPQGQVLLCAKKKTNWEFTAAIGKWNGAGGKVGAGETLEQSIVRELQEETGITLPPEAFEYKGFNEFYYENKPDRDQKCHVFVVKDFVGEPQESEELLPRWFNTQEVPYENMWVNDAIRVPGLLAGEYAEYMFRFSEDGSRILEYKKLK